MNILFICKHNRFRSKVAEAFWKKFFKNDGRFTVQSAGVQCDPARAYVARYVHQVMKEHETKIVDERPRVVDDAVLERAERIIIVADNVDKNIFSAEVQKKCEVWKIEDADESELEKIRDIVIKIKRRIIGLGEQLGVERNASIENS